MTILRLLNAVQYWANKIYKDPKRMRKDSKLWHKRVQKRDFIEAMLKGYDLKEIYDYKSILTKAEKLELINKLQN